MKKVQRNAFWHAVAAAYDEGVIVAGAISPWGSIGVDDSVVDGAIDAEVEPGRGPAMTATTLDVVVDKLCDDALRGPVSAGLDFGVGATTPVGDEVHARCWDVTEAAGRVVSGAVQDEARMEALP